MSAPAGSAAVAADGRHAFDFFEGTWMASNRKRVKPLDPSDTEWVSFDGEIVSKTILDGMGTTDTFRVPDMPGRGEFEGFTLRLLNPDTGLWRIWWASTASKGELDMPVVGRFQDERNGTVRDAGRSQWLQGQGFGSRVLRRLIDQGTAILSRVCCSDSSNIDWLSPRKWGS